MNTLLAELTEKLKKQQRAQIETEITHQDHLLFDSILPKKPNWLGGSSSWLLCGFRDALGLVAFIHKVFAYVETPHLERIINSPDDPRVLPLCDFEIKQYFEWLFDGMQNCKVEKYIDLAHCALNLLCCDYAEVNDLPVFVSVAPFEISGSDRDRVQFGDQIREDLEPIQALYEYLQTIKIGQQSK